MPRSNSTFPQRIYLASRSPRRRELLQQIGIPYDTLLFRSDLRADHEIDETPLPNEPVIDYVQRIARAKALFGVSLINTRHLRPQPVLSADTTLELSGQIIGKPVDAADAEAILARISGQTHRVLTAISIADSAGRRESALNISEVRFRTLSNSDIRRYVRTGDSLDKAGAYGIQGHAAAFIEHLSGSYSGVMGLPLFETAQMLSRFGFTV